MGYGVTEDIYPLHQDRRNVKIASGQAFKSGRDGSKYQNVNLP